jgi:hypothetical protein
MEEKVKELLRLRDEAKKLVDSALVHKTVATLIRDLIELFIPTPAPEPIPVIPPPVSTPVVSPPVSPNQT